MYTNKNRGYIALMATIIISLVLLVMIVHEGFSGWMTRFVVLGTEAKEQANALAEGCADQALASLITDTSYLGNTTSVTPAGTCKTFAIDPSQLAAGVVTIKTQAVVRDAFANLELLQSVNSIHLGSIPTAPTYGTLIVQTLVTNPATGPQKTASDFTMNVAGPSGITPSGGTFSGSASGVIVRIPTPLAAPISNYSVSEVVIPGYAPSATAGCSGTIKGGDIKSCTITNSPVTTTLTLIANVNNNDGTGTAVPADIPLFIDGTAATLGHAYTVTVGTHTVSATNPNSTTYSASAWGYQCTGAIGAGSATLNLGDNKICIINLDDNAPPAPICAETVMMLDRSGSMFDNSAWIPDEKAAAKALVDLYAGVPLIDPLVSFGRFGDASRISAEIVSTLTSNYAALKTAIDNSLSDNNSYTNLADAITKANDELNGPRHQAGKEKVLILLSDGEPNQPSTGATVSTGFFAPTANVQDSSGEFWSNPTGAYVDGGLTASDPVSEDDQHRFYNFNFPTLPSNATINGIEAKVDAWATTTGTIQTAASSLKSPSVGIAPNQWGTPTQASASDNSYTTSATVNQQQGFGGFGFAIPAGSVITGIQVSTEAKVSGGGGSTNTSTLTPDGQGSDNNWNGSESDIDETNTPSCSNGDRIDSNNNTNRESVVIDLSSVPNGALVTSVQVLTWDQGSSGGQYLDYVSVNGGTRTNSGTITVTSTSGCNARTQTIDIPDFTKSSGTDLEVGVQKVGNTTVQIGAMRAVITYIPPASGSIAVALSSNNGGSWTSVSRTVALDATESVDTPSGNSSGDLWNRTWVPADFNNGNFALRVQNNSANGITTSVDQVRVTVNYTTATPAPALCPLDMDLSWNGGSNWSSTKSQTLTNTETSYTFGSASDEWGSGFGAHNWVVGDFANGSNKFIARVHADNSGSNCNAASVEHIDQLQLQVHYTVPTDPSTAALLAADGAKQSGSKIFTIHFGDAAGRTLLAQLASGSTANGTHQPGSYNDPGGVVNASVSAFASAATSPSQFTNPTNGFTTNTQYATNSVNGNQQGYNGFALNVPPGATINNVEVLTRAKSNDFSGCQLGVALSSNSGSSYTSMDTTGVSSLDNTYTQDGASSLWGRSWLPGDFDSSKFVVRLQNIDPGNNCTNGSILSVDSVQVRVSYTVIQENGDGDNFFIAPNSSDMKGIFEFIGNQVCPAINNVGAATPPTTASLFVITRVVNNNSGTKASSDFGVTIVGTNPTPATFAGVDTPGKLVTIDPGSYSLTQSTFPPGYTQSQTDSCSSNTSSNIAAGESRVCIITNDDIPPPPPPPNLTITPGSWQEVPDTNP